MKTAGEKVIYDLESLTIFFLLYTLPVCIRDIFAEMELEVFVTQ